MNKIIILKDNNPNDPIGYCYQNGNSITALFHPDAQVVEFDIRHIFGNVAYQIIESIPESHSETGSNVITKLRIYSFSRGI